MLLFSSTIYQQYTKPDFFASLSSWVLSPGSVQSATSILTIGTLKDRMSCFYYTRLSSNSKPPTPLKLPLNPIPGEVTKLFYNVRLSLNPIRGEVTLLFYYIWLPLNPIRGEVTELFYYIWLPFNPKTELFYYIWLPLNPIPGEATELQYLPGLVNLYRNSAA